MNSIEDQIRTATRAEASKLREVRPLRLPPETAPRLAARPRLRRWPGWLAPVAAAAVVTALAVSLVIIKDGPNGPAVPAGGSATSAAGVPPYYVTVDDLGPSATGTVTCKPGVSGFPGCGLPALAASLLVADTVTGARVAVVAPPKGSTFYGVTAAADDRTFVVDTDTKPGLSDVCLPRTLYRLTIAPGTSSPTRLTRLPIPPLSCIGAIALSGSGGELAVALLGSGSAPSELRIYSTASGQLLRSWSTTDSSVFDSGADLGSDENRGVSWIDNDHAVAFPTFSLTRGAKVPGRNQWRSTEHETVRVVPVSASDGNLVTASRVVWSMSSPTTDNYPAGCQWGADPMLSADGSTVVCTEVDQVSVNQGAKSALWRLAWLAYPVADPKAPPRTLGQVNVVAPVDSTQQLAQLWINASGSAVIGARGTGFDLEKPTFFGAIGTGGFHPLPVPPGVIFGPPPPIAW